MYLAFSSAPAAAKGLERRDVGLRRDPDELDIEPADIGR
jgi:hypothetical protein